MRFLRFIIDDILPYDSDVIEPTPMSTATMDPMSHIGKVVFSCKSNGKKVIITLQAQPLIANANANNLIRLMSLIAS